MDVLTPAQRHKAMSSIKSVDTQPEIILRKALWHRGIRYRKNYKVLIGKPDIVITKYRIAIFCDGDFWHGHNAKIILDRIGTNRKYWIKKVKTNIKRDKEVTDCLSEDGWLVLRFWESDIKNDLIGCLSKIFDFLPKELRQKASNR